MCIYALREIAGKYVCLNSDATNAFDRVNHAFTKKKTKKTKINRNSQIFCSNLIMLVCKSDYPCKVGHALSEPF